MKNFDIKDVLREIGSVGGRTFLVGGAVRDMLIGREPKDFDYEVFGLDSKELLALLSEFGQVKTVGKSFGVYKLGEYEFALPRKEIKVALGHKGFDVQVDPDMSVVEAAQRRDFTINAIYMDALTDEVIDPLGGITDLVVGVIRPVDERTLVEDPLRLLRAARFASQLNMAIEINIPAIEQMEGEFHSLSSERKHEEWKKLLLGVNPTRALHWLALNTGIYPMLTDMFLIPQSPKRHPEGNVLTHTLMALASLPMAGEDEDTLITRLAVICHDFGKLKCTEIDSETGEITSRGHAQETEHAETFLRMVGMERYTEHVVALVREHMFGIGNRFEDLTDRMVKRLARRLEPANIQQWSFVCNADIQGRLGDKNEDRKRFIYGVKTRAIQLTIDLSKPEPLIKGRDLLKLGLKEGRAVGDILDVLYDKQIDDAFSYDEGMVLAKELVDSSVGGH